MLALALSAVKNIRKHPVCPRLSPAFQFTGYEYDSDTLYNYAVARFEAGRWGSFLSPDPNLGSIDISNPQSFNRYNYVLDNPTNLIDPFGLQCSSVEVVKGVFTLFCSHGELLDGGPSSGGLGGSTYQPLQDGGDAGGHGGGGGKHSNKSPLQKLTACEVMEKTGTAIAGAGAVVAGVGGLLGLSVALAPAGTAFVSTGAMMGAFGAIWAGAGAIGTLTGICEAP